MTVVRRPAYATHSCPTPGGNDFWDTALAPTPSRQTQLKSETARRYLEEHFISFMQESEARKERFERFYSQIENSNLTTEEKEALFQQFNNEETEYSRISRTKLKSARYQRIRLIGKGGFGNVWLVQDKSTSELFALKVLKKSDIILKDQLVNVRTERDILSAAINEWIVQLQYSFQDDNYLYLVLEYMCGGDLMTALIKKSVFDERATRFFAGEIILALHSIHIMNFIHRDLKPDNILIGSKGHIKLTDFGLSSYTKSDERFKELLGEIQEMMLEQNNLASPYGTHHERNNNAAGTCYYTAPEVLRSQPATTASDYWSLGVIIYEMLYGCPPFVGRSPQETALRILRWKRALRFPPKEDVSQDAVDLMKHLLCDPEQRLTFEQLIQHPFFRGFNFEHWEFNIPPFVPIIHSPTDTTHFDDFQEENEVEGLSSLPNDDLAKFAFLGYTFKQRPHSITMAKLSPF